MRLGRRVDYIEAGGLESTRLENTHYLINKIYPDRK
jgi:hypothetical protein